MGIKESALSVIASLTDSDFIRAVTAAGESRKIKATGVGKYAVETYSGSTLAGSAQSVQSAVGGLKNDITTISGDLITLQGDIATLNTNLINKLKQSLIVGTASGSIASFNNGSDIFPALKCVAKIEPNQDLHGYDAPWVGGAGKNKLPNTASTTTTNNVTFTVNADKSIKVKSNGTASDTTWLYLTNSFDLKAGAYKLSGGSEFYASNSSVCGYLDLRKSDGTILDNIRCTISDTTFTLASDMSGLKVSLNVLSGKSVDYTLYPMIRLSSVSDATYEPYENICPISGWSGVDVDVNGTTISVSWSGDAGTVYGGTVDVVSGELTITKVALSISGGFTLWGNYGVDNKPLYKYVTTPTIIVPCTTSTTSELLSNSYTPWQIDDGSGAHLPNKCVRTAMNSTATDTIYVRDDEVADVNALNAQLANNPLVLVADLATPTTYTLTAQQVDILLGDNNIFANTGPMDPVEYYADATITIQNLS